MRSPRSPSPPPSRSYSSASPPSPTQPERRPPTVVLEWLTSVAFGAIPVAFLVGLLRTRLHRSAVADLVVALHGPLTPTQVRDAIAGTLRDESLELAFWLPDRECYVGPDGTDLDPEGQPGRAVTVLEGDGGRLAALVHDRTLLDDPALIDAVGAAASLALENARLQAELRTQLNEVRASRARIVEAGDAERRRLERDLHDGAQQRLLGIRLALQLVRGRLADGGAALDGLLTEADTEVVGALDELRALARGIHPALLTDEGLDAALAALARRLPVPVELAVCPERLPATVEATAYFVASEALANVVKHAHATRATIEISRANGCVAIAVTDDGVGGADPDGAGLRGLRDRVETVDGHLRSTAFPATAHTSRRRSRAGDPRRRRRDHPRRPRPTPRRPGIDVVAQAGDADELLQHVAANPPDVAVIDIRMPPTYTNEGLVAAQQIRRHYPQVGTVVLSQYIEVDYALKLVTETAEGVGYLLKDRIADVDDFISALEVVAGGGTVVEPTLVSELLAAPAARDPLAALTPRERDVLALVAQGRTDRGIAQQLYVTRKTVEAHVRSILRKLDLPTEATENRRVHAVLAFLRHTGTRDRMDSWSAGC